VNIKMRLKPTDTS